MTVTEATWAGDAMLRSKSISSGGPEVLMDEAYLLILARRPPAKKLALALGVRDEVLGKILTKLSRAIAKFGLRVAFPRSGTKSGIFIESLSGPRGKPVVLGPQTLAVRKTPLPRPGLKPDDEIIYARDW